MHQILNYTCKKAAFVLFSSAITINIAVAGLTVSSGVTTDLLDQIDQIEDENLRGMMEAAIWPGFGDRYMNLNQADEDLTQFQKNYKEHPLNWDEKIENVRFVLSEAEDISKLTTENLEYKDIVFGEAVIPVPDRRVTAILNTSYLEGEIQRLAEEKQVEMAALYESGQTNIGDKLQAIEDKYAIKLATLIQAENEYKEAKVEFLKLEQQKKFGRIDDETYQAQILEVVKDFEDFFTIGNEVALFNEQKIKQIGSSIYDTSIQIQDPVTKPAAPNTNNTVNEKAYYWTISVILAVLSLLMGYLAFRKIRTNKKKSNF